MNTKIKKKVIILVLSSDKYPSPRNEVAQFNTWGKEVDDYGFEIKFYKGGEEFTINNQYVTFPIGDSLKDIGHKTISALEWINQVYDYEFILRANSSCFINLQALDNFLSNINTSRAVYGGHMRSYNSDFDYVEGVGIILNKKSVDIILENKNTWDHELIDDVALGKFAKSNNFKLYPIDSLYVDHNILKGNLNKKFIVYRCKMENFGYPRYLDRYFITVTHELFSNKNIDRKLIFYKIVFNVFRKVNLKYYYITYFNKIYYKITSIIPIGIKRKIKKNTRSKNLY
ncbi:hypothetical protein N9838_00755 [Acidimicrobiia bacterium]|nr:hypothetical protein [Acidimicrobiia bacterium]